MKDSKIKLIIIISLIVFISFLTLGIIDFNNYSKIIAEDNLNIIRLTSTNINSEINIELLKPIFVSLTMANDQFLKDWVLKKKEQDPEIIKEYLSGIRDKYNYDSVFLYQTLPKTIIIMRKF